MKNLFFLGFFLAACTTAEKPDFYDFPTKTVMNNAWATYEGNWPGADGIRSVELSLLQNSGEGETWFNLYENFHSKKLAGSSTQKGKFSLYRLSGNEFGIRLHNLNPHPYGAHFRVSDPALFSSKQEIFFITRGENELIPCDHDFKPLSLDRSKTLHKRLDYITVEGYVTFYNDSAEYFEKNTRQYWKLDPLGEFESIRKIYFRNTSEPYEGMYLKALAYSVADTTARNGKALVIKSIKSAGKAPEDLDASASLFTADKVEFIIPFPE
jgi:hypothetical protein